MSYLRVIENVNDKEQDFLKYIIVRVADVRMAVCTNFVEEIIIGYDITTVPMTPSNVKGLINLRGQVIPVIDINAHLDKMLMSYNESSCVIILNVSGTQIGLLAEEIFSVEEIQASLISKLNERQHLKLYNGMMCLRNEIIMFLDANQLFLW